MEFLENIDNYNAFIDAECLYPCDTPEPTEFPCFVYLKTTSFHYEEEEAVYLYKDDIQKMLDRITETTPANDAGGG